MYRYRSINDQELKKYNLNMCDIIISSVCERAPNRKLLYFVGPINCERTPTTLDCICELAVFGSAGSNDLSGNVLCAI